MAVDAEYHNDSLVDEPEYLYPQLTVLTGLKDVQQLRKS